MVAELRPSYSVHHMVHDEESRRAGSAEHPKAETPDEWWDRYVTEPFPRQFGSRSLDQLIDEIPSAPAPANAADIGWQSYSKVIIVRAGWPMPCVRYVGITAHQTSLADPIVPSDVLGKHLELPVPLPIVPVWPGLAWNTLIYATTWLLLGWSTLFGARRLRRTLRLRAIRCPACGYSLAGATTNRCPECGHLAANPDPPRVSV
jgi:DNA-directed RNA polymerase subunit RPC12/RpoP